ncbi:MAG: CaiB/BaiF CoA-transferase family protein [Pseudomonadota bacterium]
MSFEKPYEGIRVVDMSQGVAGPYCGMLLAQHGADVIKVEPAEGDWARSIGQEYGDYTAFSVTANLGKRSIVMDLKAPGSQEVMDRMIAESDVFIEGFRPGVTDRLGYSYDRLSKLNPNLIYVSISGFGQRGPMRERPAMDPLLQAFTGFMSENLGNDGLPHRTPLVMIDMATALYAQQAVAAALFAARDTGRGRKIDASLMEGAAAIQSVRVMDGYLEGPYRVASAPSGAFETQDGWLMMIIVRDREFERFCKAVGWTDFLTDPRFATNGGRRDHAELLLDAAGRLFASNTTEHWQALLTDAGVQNEKLQTYREFVEHPQTAATETVTWLQQPGAEPRWPMPNVPGLARLVSGSDQATAPCIGEHTRAILEESGYDDAAIERLLEQGVVS